MDHLDIFLGWSIDQLEGGDIIIGQRGYINAMGEKFKVSDRPNLQHL